MIDLLDTNILIYLIKNRPPQVAERIDALKEEDSLAMSFLTWAELLQRAQGSQRREATLGQLKALSRQVPVLYPEGQAICRHFAEQATVLNRLGTPIPLCQDHRARHHPLQLPHGPPRDTRSAVGCGSGSGYRRSDGISVVLVGALGP